MKILALSDIHGAYRRMLDIVNFHSSVDVIVVAGDLTTNGSPEEAEEAIDQLQRFRKPLLVVAGNMDPPLLDDVFVRLGVSLNGRGVVISGVGFSGVSASPISPLRTPNEISEEEISARAELGLMQVSGAEINLFVPHSPPLNTKLDRVHTGRHVGSSAVRSFIEKHQPHVVICGHIHEARGVDRIGSAEIINCGPVGSGFYGLISIGEDVVVECCEMS
ncbi:MAG: metallophosphoesterase family protein [Bacteroidetes bacterium]|nr:metallophosphoesterase family protein [Bacteroidota bacterium]MCW5894517.1 metallophosphoesterase family protein [Bacteroidota bacterium]